MLSGLVSQTMNNCEIWWIVIRIIDTCKEGPSGAPPKLRSYILMNMDEPSRFVGKAKP